MGWEVYPQGLYDLLTRVTRDYHPPALYVTENGAAFADEVGPDGAVHDPRRVAYLEAHVEQAARAVAAGVADHGQLSGGVAGRTGASTVGLADEGASGHADDLMAETLAPGTRRVDALDQVFAGWA